MYKVVIVDDEYLVIEGLKALLGRIGADTEVVGTASDGQSALEIIKRERPDIIITDIRIPRMDGLSLIESAKEDLPDSFYIVISGFQEFEYARRALLLGALDYISKPVTMDKLKEAMDRLEEKKNRRFSHKAEEELPKQPEPKTSEASHAAVSKIIEYLQSNYMKDIGLAEMADYVGMNPAYLSVLFKENVGISFIKYLTKLRLDKAKELLKAGYKSSEAGKQVGYNDAHYFYEIFKKNTGMTPSEYKDSI